jgi:hypothetical protein
MMVIVTILIHAASLKLQLPVCITIHNQSSNIKLVSPVYFSNCTVCPKLSDQQIDIGTGMDACFEVNVIQDEFEGALIYKLQRCVEFDDQLKMDTLTKETNKNEAKCVQMFVAWKVKGPKSLLYVALIEHIKEFTWNEDALRKLYDKNYSQLKKHGDTILDTWLIDDNTALEISFKVSGLKGNFELSISISEELRDYMRPLCVDLEK